MRKRIQAHGEAYELACREMSMIVARYESSVRSSLHVLHTMCRIALCLDNYCSSPSDQVTLLMADATCKLVRKLPPSVLHFDLVQRQVEAEISRPINTRLPPGFVYQEGTVNKRIVLYKFITPPTSGMQLHGTSLCIRVIYLPSGFLARVLETEYMT
jgi:hypothetical protein